VLITKRGEPLGRRLEWDDSAKSDAEDFGNGIAPPGNKDFDEVPF
jgi:hypothetical protein